MEAGEIESAGEPYEYADRYALLASLQFVVFGTGERHILSKEEGE
jgi:hypothetical protein